MQPPKAIILDIDGTIAPDISWTALTRDLGGSVNDHLRIFKQHRQGTATYEQSRDELLRLWQATGHADKAYFQHLFKSWPLSSDALATVDILREQYQLCIITGSMDLYAETVAGKLGITDFYANSTLQWNDQWELINFDYELRQSERKLEQLLEYCAIHNLQPTDCVAVGDSDNDVELFKATGYGIAIGQNVPAELAAVAQKTVGTLSELPTVIARLTS